MGETLHELYSSLNSLVVSDDINSQLYYLGMVEEHRHIPVDYLIELGVMFIPNNEYIRYYLGNRLDGSNVGLYYGDNCAWTLFVTIPIRDLSGTICGIVGWDAYNKYKSITEGQQDLPSYKVSHKSVFPREKYFLGDIECLKRNFDSRVVFVTDGVFDALSLSYRNIPAVALLGSSFSSELLYFFSWYKVIYICADNDEAGNKLYERLRRANSNVYCVRQNKTKDIEELLRTDGKDGPITRQLKSLVVSPVRSDVMLEGAGSRRFRRSTT